MTRRSPSGRTSAVDLDGAYALLPGHGAGCRAYPALFGAPGGGLGLDFECDGTTTLTELDDAGKWRLLGSPPAGWRFDGLRPGAGAGSGFTGLVFAHVAAVAGNGDCRGIRRVVAGRLAPPFPTVAGVDISPPDRVCAAGNRWIGVSVAAETRDGSLAFLADRGVDETLWWWPAGAAAPHRIGRPFTVPGGAGLSLDPAGGRLLLSAGDTVTLVDLGSGRERTLFRSGTSQAAFAPDGRSFLYVQGDGDLRMLSVSRAESGRAGFALHVLPAVLGALLLALGGSFARRLTSRLVGPNPAVARWTRPLGPLVGLGGVVLAGWLLWGAVPTWLTF